VLSLVPDECIVSIVFIVVPVVFLIVIVFIVVALNRIPRVDSNRASFGAAFANAVYGN
jgi:hypothetical protein